MGDTRGRALENWVDRAQYHAEPQPNTTDHAGVQPSVHLIDMNHDPLGSMAAFTEIYKGGVVRSLAQITDDQRKKVLEDVQKTHLKAPLEVIKMHFLFEGVDRAFTHQHVRQRTAVYGQESMRFAVLGELLDATTLPPALAGVTYDPKDDRKYMSQAQRNRQDWDETIKVIDASYHSLVANGVAAEEARGLLPHATATRIHYVTDLRNLPEHAGNRLCTQAQFHWRQVFALVVEAIAKFTPDFSWMEDEDREEIVVAEWEASYRWQFKAIANSELFRPACYQLGYCPFEASFDRSCSIRERVQVRAENGGKDSRDWAKDFLYYDRHDNGDCKTSPGISVAEWLIDPAAARS